MADLKLNVSTGDLDFSSGDLELVEGLDAIAQNVRIALRFFLAEWFLDTRVGMPYYERLLGQKPRESVVRTLFRQALFKIDGILTVSSISIDFDGVTRKVDVAFSSLTTAGPLEFDEELIL